jgi:hypothetical protein
METIGNIQKRLQNLYRDEAAVQLVDEPNGCVKWISLAEIGHRSARLPLEGHNQYGRMPSLEKYHNSRQARNCHKNWTLPKQACACVCVGSWTIDTQGAVQNHLFGTPRAI